VSSKRASCSLK